MKDLTRVAVILLGLAITGSALAAPADELHILPPSDYKKMRRGLWEMTRETTTQGGPKIDMSQIQAKMADTMKNLSPEQRARVEAIMQKQSARSQGMPDSNIKKECVTAEKIDKGFADAASQNNLGEIPCTMKEVNRTSSKLVVSMACSSTDKGQFAKAEGRGNGSTTIFQNGTMSFEVKSSTEMETRIQMDGLIGREPMKSDMKMDGHWVAADCGKVK